jgi:hypothetical protein
LRLGDKLIEPLFFRICIDSMTGLHATDKIEDINTMNKKPALTGARPYQVEPNWYRDGNLAVHRTRSHTWL